MQPLQNPPSIKEFMRAKRRSIFRQYFDLMRAEMEENPDRAKYISKVYYAERVARSQNPPMRTDYVIKIINRMLRKGEN